MERLKELIRDGLVEAQFYGIDDSPIVKKIQAEMDNRFDTNTGEPKKIDL
jgi:hypothetical protein